MLNFDMLVNAFKFNKFKTFYGFNVLFGIINFFSSFACTSGISQNKFCYTKVMLLSTFFMSECSHSARDVNNFILISTCLSNMYGNIFILINVFTTWTLPSFIKQFLRNNKLLTASMMQPK